MKKMPRHIAVWFVIVFQGGLIGYTLYVLLSASTFPWAWMGGVLVVSAALIFLMRNLLFGVPRVTSETEQAGKFDIVRYGIWNLVGSVLGLFAGLLYSYLTHKAIRWGTYVGMLVPMSLFAIALWVHWLRKRRGRTYS